MRQTPQEVPQDNVLRPLDAKGNAIDMKQTKKDAVVVLVVYIVLMLFGVGTGYLLSQKSSSVLTPKGTPITTNKVVGVQDASTFKDCATGKIEKEGFEGEGTHKLIRDGGPSQTAYLISSIVDLDQYVNLTVKVCGQTLGAKKVSWLMDVGRLELE
ncbi:hypothetical protein HZB58_02950 [Candidatus Gottesmanbacteria bacterium]|nr:hypothetical protein [Candidatus Gottesmanbacteria bacterium]